MKTNFLSIDHDADSSQHAMPPCSSLANTIVLAAFFASGFAGLVYQVAWFRMTATVLGNTVHATAAVLAAFMAGLAIGSRVFGRLAPKLKSPLFIYALQEVSIGVWAMGTPWMIRNLHFFFVPIAQAIPDTNAVGTVMRFLIALLPMLLPTFLMGGTLPVLAEYFTRTGRVPYLKVGSLYSLNTLGAMTGTAVAGFVMIERFGLQNTVWLAACVNLAVGIILLLLVPKLTLRQQPETPAGSKPLNSHGYLLPLFFVTGFAALGLEVCWTRLLVLHFGSSVYAFSVMLLTFLLGVSLGALIGGWIAQRFGRPALWLGLVLLIIPLALFMQFSQFLSLSEWMENLVDKFSFFSHAQIIILYLLAGLWLLFIPTFAMGLAFPLAVRLLQPNERVSGEGVGQLYFWNTLGNLSGAVVTALVLVPLLGVQLTILSLAIMELLAATYLLARQRLVGEWRRAMVAVIAAAIFLSGYQMLYAKERVMEAASPFLPKPGEKRETVFFAEDAGATVSLQHITSSEHNWLSLNVNGVNVAGTTPDLITIQKMQGHLPLLIHGNAKSVCHIGLGSGGTAAAVATHPVKQITIVEMSPSVITASGEHLRIINKDVLIDPRVRLIVQDGRNFLLTTTETFDVILSDSIHPRYSGNGSLYTLDYYRLCAKRLNPGGIVSMWLPMYGVTPRNFRMILLSFQAVFPHTMVWYVNSTINSYSIVMGSREPAQIDMTRLAAQLTGRVFADLATINAHDPERILDYFITADHGVEKLAGDVPFHTDDRTAVEYESAREINRHKTVFKNLKQLAMAREEPFPYLTGRYNKSRLERFYEATSHSLLGYGLYLRGRIAEAREEYLKAVAINPEDQEPVELFIKFILNKE
tara:strand:+ start:1984 stop:4581 length:2598 start_codon:yes stop_codon:yes gene_type:complete